MEIYRFALYVIFYILVGVAALCDLRRRTIPVWIGWAAYGLALTALLAAGLWARMMILILLVLAFRLRKKSRWTDAFFFVALLTIGYREDIWFILPAMAVYILLCMGWLGVCDAEIAFPLIALFGSEALTVYLVCFWIFVPPIAVVWQRGIDGGMLRFIHVARHMLLGDASPLDDKEALRLPWIASPFLALTLYFFVFPAQVILWYRLIFQSG
jgi:hypothetical protein